MSNELNVWLFSDPVGALTLRGGRLNFTYSPSWLSRKDATPLSASLPLRAEPFDDYAARPFFAGLLPEGQVRRTLSRNLRVSVQNEFALLDLIGGECAGAVTFLKPGQPLPTPHDDEDVQWLSNEEFAEILDELPRFPMLADRYGVRVSLAGAQNKLPIIFDGVRFGIPFNGAPSSHILKPAIHGIEDSVYNEGFCMALARAMNLGSAHSEIHRVLNHSFLLIERYDRISDGRGLRRPLHQEDFCQALGVAPERKYQNEGGPNLEQCFNFLRRTTHSNELQAFRLFDGVVYNTLIGNHDAHAKNFSVLYEKDKAFLAPFYDMISTAVYPKLTPKMAMKIGSKYKFSEVETRHWEDFARKSGISWVEAKNRILEFSRLLPVIARNVQSSHKGAFSHSPIINNIIALIEQRCDLTIRRLSVSAEKTGEIENEDSPQPNSSLKIKCRIK